MITASQLITWLSRQSGDSGVYIDEGGITLETECGAYLEVGGKPLEEENEE